MQDVTAADLDAKKIDNLFGVADCPFMDFVAVYVLNTQRLRCKNRAHTG